MPTFWNGAFKVMRLRGDQVFIRWRRPVADVDLAGDCGGDQGGAAFLQQKNLLLGQLHQLQEPVASSFYELNYLCLLFE